METKYVTYALFGLACLLLVITTIQAVQIDALSESPSFGSGSQVSAPLASPQPAAQAPVAAPVMVGGC